MKYVLPVLAASVGVLPSQAGTPRGGNDREGQHPNVLFLMVDDMNGYGVMERYPDIITPNLQRLRSQSVNFANNCCASPVSTPSRTSFLSGLYPHHTGGYLNGCDAWSNNPQMADPSKVETLPECFKKNGYETWGRGKTFHSPLPQERLEAMYDNRPLYQGGFGPFYEGEYQGGTKFFAIRPWDDSKDDEHPDNKNTEAAIEFFSQQHDKPFLMCLGLWKPHCPYTSPKRFFDLYKDKKLPLPKGFKPGDLDDVPDMGRNMVDSLARFKYDGTPESETLWRQFLEAYCANNSFADWNIGRVLDALDNSPYADNTIVVFCSDNGYHCGEKLRWEKGTMWEQSAYCPMMIRLPKSMREQGKFRPNKGATCEVPVGLIDIYPTLVDLCGLTPPVQKLDGESMRSLLMNPKMKSDRINLTTYSENLSSVRDVRYRLITYPDGTQELYDLKKDPYEWKNLIGDDKYKEVVVWLEKRIPTMWAKSLGGRFEVAKQQRESAKKSFKK